MNTIESLLGSYFTEPDDNPNFNFAGYAERSAGLNGPDADPDVCAICLSDPANEMSGICSRCEANEGEALERDLEATR